MLIHFYLIVNILQVFKFVTFTSIHFFFRRDGIISNILSRAHHDCHLPKNYTIQVKWILYDACGRYSDSQDILQCG